MTLRVVLDALGLPGSVPPLTTRKGMHSVMSDVILEAEMVAFSDATGSIDGKQYLRFSHLFYPQLCFRVLENPESRREHRSRSEA